MKKALFLSFVSISCLATAAAHAATQAPRFNSIDASGNLTVSIVPNKHSSAEYFSVREPAKSHARVNARIRNHTLYLSQASPATVTIYMNDLNNLTVYGNSGVSAKNIRSNGLDLIANTSGKITLNGTIKLNKISASGLSKINLKWVSGNNIALFSNADSHINLAGEVGTIRAKLAGHSFLNAKYLRSQHAWIRTRNFAQAEVISAHSLQAYPSDSSNIYYYKTPKLLNPINSQAGNTLQLGWNS
jgi:hypothetical protein